MINAFWKFETLVKQLQFDVAFCRRTPDKLNRNFPENANGKTRPLRLRSHPCGTMAAV
jgi:hypothetical protein